MKKIPKKYREMTELQKRRLPLLERYRQYFNEYRGAGIEMIGSVSTADPTNREIRVRYKDGRPDVPIGDVLSWTQLFDKLSEMHPKPVKGQDLSLQPSPANSNENPSGVLRGRLRQTRCR